MSVLPSFKSAFSSFADAEGVRVADDSGFALSQPASTTNSGPPRHSHSHSPFQDHFPTRPSNAWSYLQTTTTGASTMSNLKEQRKPELTRHHLHPRPAVAPLPLDQLSGDLDFGFASRSTKGDALASAAARRRIVDPLPLENLAFSAEPFDFRTESFKRAHSPSVHAGAYKRPRSQSVSAGGAYVKSQSSSERRAKLLSPSSGRELSGSAGFQSPIDRLSSASGPASLSAGSSRKDSVKVSGLLSSTTITRQTATIAKQTATKSFVRPSAAGVSLPRPVSVSRELSDAPNQYSRRGVANGSGSGGHDGQKHSVSPGVSAGHRVSPSPSTIAPSNVRTNSSIPFPASGKAANLVSFAAPSLSHRSGGSKGISIVYNTRILAEDDIIEDSTFRVAVDVLSSPRQRSVNSTLTGRTGTGLPRGALGHTLALSRGPTASDVSVLLGHTRQDRQERDEKSTAVEESEAGVAERQKQSMTTTESVVGSDGEQIGQKSDSGDRMNLSCIVKKRSAGSLRREYNLGMYKLPGNNVDVKGSSVNGHRNGRVHTGDGTTPNLWGGQGGDSDADAGQWKGKGESSGEQEHGRVEAWRQGPKPVVGKSEEKVGSIEMNGNENRNGRVRHEKLWGGEVSGDHEVGSGNGGMGVYNGSDEWSEGGEKDGTSVYVVGMEEKNKKNGNGEKSGEEEDSVQCPHCERRLRNQVTLQNHVRVVHEHSGNFRCDQCCATFMWRSTLGNHVRLVHEKQRPFGCKECNKAFRWKSHLREHTWVVHKGEKPFQCETCGKTFGRKNNMQKHMRKHSETGS